MRAWNGLRGWFEKPLYRCGCLSARGLTLPHFLGIGAQKAGTSWLHENLRSHPQLYLPAEKELHYWNLHYRRPLREYAGAFQDAGQRTRGEITPAYGILPRRRIALIRRLMPDLRLVLLLRNPIERAWSQALMELITDLGRSFADVRETEFLQHFASQESLRRGDYVRIVENWRRYFPAERLFVGLFDDVAERPRELLEMVLRHLGVSADVDWTRFPLRRVVFAGPAIPLPVRFRGVLESLYADRIEQCAEMIDERMVRWRAERGSGGSVACR